MTQDKSRVIREFGTFAVLDSSAPRQESKTPPDRRLYAYTSFVSVWHTHVLTYYFWITLKINGKDIDHN